MRLGQLNSSVQDIFVKLIVCPFYLNLTVLDGTFYSLCFEAAFSAHLT